MSSRFDLVDLELFVHVAEAGSITAGAARAHIALASASARIRGMEDVLGTLLFDRNHHGVALTGSGRALLHHARAIAHQLELLREDLGQYAKGVRGQIRLMCNTAGLSEVLRVGLSVFLAEHPSVGISLQECLSEQITLAIAEGSADVGIVSEAADLSGLETFPFRAVRLVLVTGMNHPLGLRERVRFAETLEFDFVGIEGSALQEYLDKLATRAGARLRCRVELPTYDIACRMIERDVGIGIMPASAAEPCRESMEIRLVELDEPWAFRDHKICVRRFGELAPYARRLVEAIRS